MINLSQKTIKTLKAFGVLFGINLLEYIFMTAGLNIFSNRVVGLLVINAISILILKQMDLIKDA